MNRNIIRQTVNVVALAVTLVVNFLATALPLNGQTSAEIANRVPILFVPANYVFSIWGLIYMLLIGFGIYQALPSQRENPRLRRVGYWFALSCVANFTWLFLFHYEQFPLSMIAMIVLLVALIVIYIRLEIGREKLNTAGTWLLHIPFSVYLGWITVATVANASYVLYTANWDGLGISGEVWTVIMLVIATGITVAMIVTRRDIAYSAVIVWALVGIVVKQAAIQTVAATAGVMVGLEMVALVAALWLNRGNKAIQITSK